METTFALLTACSAGVLLATILTYERMLARARYERDEAIADAALATDLFIDAARAEAKDRHPSQQYGGANLRIVR